jgi:signal transduction histidine kinase
MTKAIQYIVRKNKKTDVFLKQSTRLLKFRELITKYHLRRSFHQSSFEDKLNLICKDVAEVLEVDVVSVYFMKSETTAACKARYEHKHKTYSAGFDVDYKKNPDFLTSLQNNNLIPIYDLPKNKVFYNCYLDHTGGQTGIKAIVYANFYQAGQLFGFVCVEYFKSVRMWETDELAFINNIAAIINQASEKETKDLMEIELKASNKRFLDTLETMTNGFVYLNEYQECQFINSNAFSILEIEPVDVKNKTLWAYLPNELSDKLKKLVSFVTRENRGVNKTGFINVINKWIEFWAYPTNNDVFILFSDVTNKKLTEKTLLDNQRMSTIGQITNAFSRDFYNSMQLVFSNLEILQNNKQNLEKVADKHLDLLSKAANDAVARIQILQRFAGVKKSQSDYERVTLNTVISEAVSQMKLFWELDIAENPILVRFSEQLGDTSDVMANDMEIRSVLYNMFNNARDAMQRGGQITIETLQDNGFVVLKISDTGEGIPDENISRVFEPFFTTRGLEIGKGVGLSSVKSVIDEHKGTIKVLTTAGGKGTTFEIRLPIYDVKDDVTLIESDTKLKVLWVDDDRWILDLALDFFGILGHELIVAESGLEALEILKTTKFDFIFTDIGMPVMNGWQFISNAHEIGIDKTKIIVISGWGHQIAEEQINEYGLHGAIAKPVKLAQIKRILHS